MRVHFSFPLLLFLLHLYLRLSAHKACTLRHLCSTASSSVSSLPNFLSVRGPSFILSTFHRLRGAFDGGNRDLVVASICVPDPDPFKLSAYYYPSATCLTPLNISSKVAPSLLIPQRSVGHSLTHPLIQYFLLVWHNQPLVSFLTELHYSSSLPIVVASQRFAPLSLI